MVPTFRYIIKIIAILLLLPMKLFPINMKKILLLNDMAGNNPNYSGNIKYIIEYVLKNHKNDFLIILPLGMKNNHLKSSFPNNVKVVTLNSITYFYHALTCSVFITTNGGISYIPFKKKQIVINTWHGVAYKMMGLDVVNDNILKKALKLAEQKTDYFVSPSSDFSKSIKSAFLIPEEKVLNFGLPRNDIIFDKKRHRQIRDKVKAVFDIAIEEKIVIYTPTFRTVEGNIFGKHQLGPYDLDFEMVIMSLENRFGGSWVLAIRLHPSLAKINLDLPSNVINMSNYEDPQELFIASDAMINDYSSTMWDFGLTYKPCFIYASDLNEYNSEIGFYTNPKEWPFPIATNNEKLSKLIMDFKLEKYKDKLDFYFKNMGNFEKGEASKQLVNLIISKTSN